MDPKETTEPRSRRPLDHTELVHRLDHAVFGVDNETGLLHHMREVESKLDKLIGVIVVSSLALSVAMVSAAVTIAITL